MIPGGSSNNEKANYHHASRGVERYPRSSWPSRSAPITSVDMPFTARFSAIVLTVVVAAAVSATGLHGPAVYRTSYGFARFSSAEAGTCGVDAPGFLGGSKAPATRR